MNNRFFGTLLLMVFSILSYGQGNYSFKGNVSDENGEALIGATVQVKGTTVGSSTDIDGNFSFNYDQEGAILVISYIGYETLEQAFKAGITQSVSLKEGSIFLSDAVVLGTRSLKRTSTETPVAIDLIPISQLAKTAGQLDVNQILQYLAPSFNSNKQSGADGADHIDPATLRGLGPDQTLVLVNGKRLHQTALINLYGTRGRGNTGTDLNSIPASAIERIEILRDGASAQYGSDAIAGVINVVLKENVDELTAGYTIGGNITGYGSSVKMDGQNLFERTNDGLTMNANFNYGWKVTKAGFVNFTADITTKRKTLRPQNEMIYPDNYRKQFGEAANIQPAMFYNSKFRLTDKFHLYSQGGFTYRSTDAAAFSRDADSPRNIPEIYPNGFDPHILSVIHDGHLTVGTAGKIGTWDLDMSSTVGANRFHFFGDQTLNASLGANSPTHFDDGGFQFIQNATQIGVTKNFENVLQGLNFAAGTEYRYENYQIFAGEEGSWQTYGPVIASIDSLFDDDDVFVGLDTVYRPGGSQGFPGFRPSDELKRSRHNIGLYADVELDVTKAFLLQGAIRYEYYNDFGSTVNFKFATRYKFNDKFMLRGSVSTGFRAPSLAQIYFRSTFTDVVAGTVIDKVIANNESDIVKALGIPKLKQEKSLNAAWGFTARPADGFSITADGYYVGIKDRIVLTGAFSSDDPDIGADLQALNVGGAQFFTNALNTTTFGVDLVASYNNQWGDHSLTTTLAGNYNHMKLGAVNTNEKLAGKEETYFGIREKGFLLASAPRSKVNLSMEYKYKGFSFSPRLSFFDKVDLINWRAYGDGDIADAALASGDMDAYNAAVTDVYKPKVTLDLAVGYEFCKHVTVLFGASNILDTYPTAHDPGWTESGGMWDAAQMGFGGAFYYGKILLNFKDTN